MWVSTVRLSTSSEYRQTSVNRLSRVWTRLRRSRRICEQPELGRCQRDLFFRQEQAMPCDVEADVADLEKLLVRFLVPCLVGGLP